MQFEIIIEKWSPGAFDYILQLSNEIWSPPTIQKAYQPKKYKEPPTRAHEDVEQ